MQDGVAVSQQWTTWRLGGLAAFVLGVMMLTMSGLTGLWCDSALMALVTGAMVIEGIPLAGGWSDTLGRFFAMMAYTFTALAAYIFARVMPIADVRHLLVGVPFFGILAIVTALLAYIETRTERRIAA